MARSNYQFNKRQKEIARKKKKEEKRQRKLDKNTIKSERIQISSRMKKRIHKHRSNSGTSDIPLVKHPVAKVLTTYCLPIKKGFFTL